MSNYRSEEKTKIMSRSISEDRYKYLCELLQEAVSKKQEKDKIAKKDLAKLIGITPSDLSKILQGARRMDPIIYYDVCEALGIDFAKTLRHISLSFKRTGKKPDKQ
jgi:transcriptional regulator with XRE-family HTH domain